MATEIWKLQERLEEVSRDRDNRPPPPATTDKPIENGHAEEGHESANLDQYSPNNPRAMNRKIGKIESFLLVIYHIHESGQ